jgi:hypothetical protein
VQVISELDRPRQIFPRASWYGMLVVVGMFTAMNFIYVIPTPVVQGQTADPEANVRTGRRCS